MLSLRKLRFCNIGRFLKEQEIDFSVFDKLIQANGFNRNTGGSSGAAKSTVFHALDYLLGINDIPATGLQSRLTKTAMYAEGEFDVDGIPLFLRRSKKEGLTLKFGDETISGNVKLAEERLEEIIGIPKKLFKKMIHKKQKEGGFFLKLTAKESYDFLMNVLGLEELKLKTTKIDEDIKEIINRITKLGHAIDALTNSIEEIEELREFEKPPRCDVNKEDLLKTKSILDALNVEIHALEKTKIDDLVKLTDLKPKPPVLVANDNDEIPKIELELNSLREAKQAAILDFLERKKKLSSASDELKNKLSQIPHAKVAIERAVVEMKDLIANKEHIESQKCPTCMQQWAGDTAEDKITGINIKLTDLKMLILHQKAITDEEESTQKQLNKLSTIIQKMDSENNSEEINSKISDLMQKVVSIKANRNLIQQKIENDYLKELNIFNEKFRVLTESYDLIIKPKKESGQGLLQEIHSKTESLKYYDASLIAYNTKIEKYDSTLAEKRSNLKDGIEQRDSQSKNLSIAEETKRLIKAFTLQIFQETLDTVGNYATEILSDIPNMSNATVYFEGCKENNSGTIRDEVNAIINMDGYDDINIKTLSGGERTVIDLAVDIAVIDMIESRTGKGADFLILDEPFDGLEDINISQCLEVLRQVDTNKKIIIVDHNPIVKEMITDSIIVERNGEESVVL